MIWKVAIFFLVFFLLFSIFVFYIGLKKGLERSIAHLYKALDDLLTFGYDDGCLIINIGYTRKFIQFKKYIRSKNQHGIELFFPNVGWSQSYFKRLKVLCTNNEIPFLITERDSVEFLCIDYGRNISLAHAFIKKVFIEVFEVDTHQKFFVRLENAAMK